MAFFEGCPVGWGKGSGKGWLGGARLGAPELAWWEAGQGLGGRPRALIPGEGVREGLAWQLGGYPPELAWWTGGQGGGARARGGGARASVPGG